MLQIIIEIARKEKTIGNLYFVAENVRDFTTSWWVKTSNKHSKHVYIMFSKIETNLLQEPLSLLFFLFSPLGFSFSLQKNVSFFNFVFLLKTKTGRVS